MRSSSTPPLEQSMDGPTWPRRFADKKSLFRLSEVQHTIHCLRFQSAPNRIPLYLGKRRHCADAALPMDFTRTTRVPPPVYSPSKPAARCRCSAFFYSEYFCAAHRAHTLGGRSAVLEHNPPRVLYLPLLSTLHAISCCHHSLLLFLLLVYCYYKSKALSIPARLQQARSRDYADLDRSQGILDLRLADHVRHSSSDELAAPELSLSVASGISLFPIHPSSEIVAVPQSVP